jgi:hypothetical protein
MGLAARRSSHQLAVEIMDRVPLTNGRIWRFRNRLQQATNEMKKFALVVYGIFGAVAIIFGTALLLVPTSLLSEAAQSVHFTHILREQGAAIVFIGLMAFWCLFNYERTAPYTTCLWCSCFWTPAFTGSTTWAAACRWRVLSTTHYRSSSLPRSPLSIAEDETKSIWQLISRC